MGIQVRRCTEPTAYARAHALRVSLGLITMSIVLVTGLAFLGVVGFFAYLVWRFIVDKMNGW
ncbi:MAG: hypothetical protein EBU21_10705 [Proteobacteria bacterium]|nr:hypothetical protein [Pseudomonadota bacterium]